MHSPYTPIAIQGASSESPLKRYQSLLRTGSALLKAWVFCIFTHHILYLYDTAAMFTYLLSAHAVFNIHINFYIAYVARSLVAVFHLTVLSLYCTNHFAIYKYMAHNYIVWSAYLTHFKVIQILFEVMKETHMYIYTSASLLSEFNMQIISMETGPRDWNQTVNLATRFC